MAVKRTAKKTATKSSEFAESIINTIREPLIVLDQNLKVVTASRSFYAFFKVKPEETVGRLIYDLGDKQWDIPRLRELLETILPEKTTFDNYEVEHDFATIGRRIMLLNARQIERGPGKERIILLAIEDITEQKDFQVKLEESEKRFRGAFETSRDGLLLIHKIEGDILNSNASAQKLLGYSAEEFLKKKLWTIGMTKDHKNFQEMMSRLERDGMIYYKNTSVKTREGTSISADIFLVDRAAVMQCNIRDITERKQADEKLRNSEMLFSLAVKSSNDLVYIWDLKHTTQWFGKIDELLGYEPGEFPRTFESWQALLHPDDRERIIAEIQTSIKEQKPFISEYRIRRKDGVFLWWSVRGIVSRTPEGKPLQWIGSITDITESKNATISLRESEERFRSVFENSTTGILVVDTATKKLLFANPAVCNMLGYTEKELTTLGMQNIHPQEYLPAIMEAFEKQAKKEINLFSCPVQRKNGSVFYADINSFPLKMNGKLCMVGMFTDIDERKKLEDRQQLSYECLNLLNKQPDTLNTISDILNLIKQHSNIEAVGIRLRKGEDFPYFAQNGFPEEFVEKENSLCSHDKKGNLRLDEQGKPCLECMCGNIICGRTDPELPFFTKGGSFWTNSTTDLLATTTEKDRQARTRNYCNTAGYESVALVPLRSGDEIIGLLQLNDHKRDQFTIDRISFFEGLCTNIGITLARTQMDKQLTQISKHQEALLTSIPDIVIETDCNKVYTWANKAGFEFFGDDVIGKEASFYFVGEQNTLQNIQPLLDNTQQVINLNSLQRRQDGQPRLLTWWSQSLKDSTGKVTGTVSIARDITEIKQDEEKRKSLQEQLVRSEKLAAVGELIAGVAHEINNPLTGIMGLSELLVRENKGTLGKETMKDIESIYQSSERIHKIVQNLLRFARREEPMRKNVSICEIIDTILTIREYEMKSRNIKVERNCPQEIPQIMADPSQLEQVFLNIVTNAEYSMLEAGRGGTLSINLFLKGKRPEPQEAVVEIADTGRGIPADVIPKLFDPFFTTKPVGKGTGLGLPVSYGIIKEHGGEINAGNRKEGGAIFTITLPVQGGENDG